MVHAFAPQVLAPCIARIGPYDQDKTLMSFRNPGKYIHTYIYIYLSLYIYIYTEVDMHIHMRVYTNMQIGMPKPKHHEVSSCCRKMVES